MVKGELKVAIGRILHIKFINISKFQEYFLISFNNNEAIHNVLLVNAPPSKISASEHSTSSQQNSEYSKVRQTHREAISQITNSNQHFRQ